MWDIYELMKGKHSPSSGTAEVETNERHENAHKETIQKSIQRMELTMDGLLRSSYRLICVVAVCVWFFVALSFAVDLLGFGWADRSYLSTHRAAGNSATRSATGAGRGTPIRGDARGDRLREMGAGFRSR